MGIRTPGERLRDFLEGGKGLLVLDNLEQVQRTSRRRPNTVWRFFMVGTLSFFPLTILALLPLDLAALGWGQDSHSESDPDRDWW
ncbi:MAG: hypothetical protein M3Q03_12200 [Chloroflexota bacterium]|nr:hypothetical protein [Chloroflexota bacterium]